MKYLLGSFLTLIIINLSAQSNYNPAPQIWTVNFEAVSCAERTEGCLLVKFPGKKEFEIFSEGIEGFNFEKGYTYTLSVKQELKQPPIAAGESLFKYVLVKILTKKSVNAPAPVVSESTTSPASAKIIFEVNYESVPCEANKNCLLIREKGKKEFELFQGNIAGFNYQPGYSYVIEVKPTIDGNYYFVNEVSKKFVKNTGNTESPLPAVSSTPGKIIQQSSIQTSSPLDRKWYLRKMKEVEGSSIITDDNVMWIEINTFKDRLDGFGACNNFAAVVKSDLVTTFEISKLTTNYSMCGNKKVEDLFYDLLQQADRFELRNGNLILSRQWKYLLAFTADPNNKEEITTTYVPQSIIKNENTSYATDASLKDGNNSTEIPVTTSTVNAVVQSNTISNTPATKSSTKTTVPETTITKEAVDPVIEAKNKEIEELKKQLASKKIEEELKQQPTENSPNIENKQTGSKNETTKTQLTQYSPASAITSKTTTPSDTKTETNAIPVNDNVTLTKSDINEVSEYPNPKLSNAIYYKKDNKLILIENDNGIIKGTDRNMYLELNSEESKMQFPKGKIPPLVIKTDGSRPSSDYISLYTCDFKKEKRQINIRPAKNKVLTSYAEIAPNTYELILPENLGEGEYIFVLQSDLNKPMTYNSTNLQVYCFGVIYK